MEEKEESMKRGFTKQDFYNRLHPNGDCLEWIGGNFNTGYGQTRAYGKMWLTHRLALHLEGIDVSDHYVLHSCDNPCCCNPAHLRIGTHQDNMDDKVKRGRQNRKLTEEQVLEIRSITGMYQRDIAAQYGVKQPIINKILNRKLWQHI